MPKPGDGEAQKWIAAFTSMFKKPETIEILEKRPGRRGRIPGPTTIRQYGYSLRWINQRMDGFVVGEKVPCPEDVLDYMETAKVDEGRRKNVYVAMKMWHLAKGNTSCCEKYSSHLKRCCDAIANQKEKQTLTKSQSKNWIDHKDLKKFAAQMRTDVLAFPKKQIWGKPEYTKATLAFVILFHMKHPVRRDLFTVRYGSGEHANYLDENAKEIVLRKYKTSDTHGEQRFKLSRPMWTIAQRLIAQQRMRDISSGYLILNTYFKPMKSNGFSQWFSREMAKRCEAAKGKRVGCTMMRRIVITHLNKNQKTWSERKAIADKCMHSVKTHESYRVTQPATA